MSNEPISLATLREAIQIAKAGGTEEHPYDQSDWGDNECGTACCVGGFARLLSGQRIERGSPEVEGHPAALKIRELMLCRSPDVLRVMESVDDNGVIQLAGADLRGVTLRATSLRGANLEGANLEGADLGRTVLANANLQDANLQESRLIAADLGGASLRGANLQGANLTGANLRGTDLRKANLAWAELEESCLEDANLAEANLRDANLTGADLIWTILRRADLTGANLEGAGLPQGFVLSSTGLVTTTTEKIFEEILGRLQDAAVGPEDMRVIRGLVKLATLVYGPSHTPPHTISSGLWTLSRVVSGVRVHGDQGLGEWQAWLHKTETQLERLADDDLKDVFPERGTT